MGRANVIIADLQHFSGVKKGRKLLIFKALVGCWFVALQGTTPVVKDESNEQDYDL